MNENKRLNLAINLVGNIASCKDAPVCCVESAANALRHLNALEIKEEEIVVG